MKDCCLPLLLLLAAFFAGCYVEDENAPLPIDNFAKYYGDLGASYTLADIDVLDPAEQAKHFILLGTRMAEGSSDMYVVKTDAEGYQLADAVLGLSENSIARKLHVSGDSIFILGNTSGGIVWSLLDSNLNPILLLDNKKDTLILATIDESSSQVASARANDIIKTKDGNLVIVGNYQADTTQNFRLKIDLDPNIGSADLDPDNPANPYNLKWFRGNENSNTSDIIRVFEEDDDSDDPSLVFFGTTSVPSSDGGEKGGTNVIYIASHANGVATSSRSYGLVVNSIKDVDDVPADVVRKPGGGYVVTGTSTYGTNKRTFLMNIFSSEQFGDTTLTSTFKKDTLGTPLNTNGSGVTVGINGDFIVVGNYPDFSPQSMGVLSCPKENKGEEMRNKSKEMMFVRTRTGQGHLDTGFTTTCETNYGLDGGDDEAHVAVTLSDGKIMVGATIDFGGGVKLMSLIKLNDTGLLDE